MSNRLPLSRPLMLPAFAGPRRTGEKNIRPKVVEIRHGTVTVGGGRLLGRVEKPGTRQAEIVVYGAVVTAPFALRRKSG